MKLVVQPHNFFTVGMRSDSGKAGMGREAIMISVSACCACCHAHDSSGLPGHTINIISCA